MKKSRFTETQIVKAIKVHEAGRKVEQMAQDLIKRIARYQSFFNIE
ncbi:hypothetical protein [Algoriphagus jejuensis]